MNLSIKTATNKKAMINFDLSLFFAQYYNTNPVDHVSIRRHIIILIEVVSMKDPANVSTPYKCHPQYSRHNKLA